MVHARQQSRLSPIGSAQLLQTLADQSGFISASEQTAKRFQMLTRIARAAPAYRLDAGRNQRGVPSLLRSLLQPDERDNADC